MSSGCSLFILFVMPNVTEGNRKLNSSHGGFSVFLFTQDVRNILETVESDFSLCFKLSAA